MPQKLIINRGGGVNNSSFRQAADLTSQATEFGRGIGAMIAGLARKKKDREKREALDAWLNMIAPKDSSAVTKSVEERRQFPGQVDANVKAGETPLSKALVGRSEENQAQQQPPTGPAFLTEYTALDQEQRMALLKDESFRASAFNIAQFAEKKRIEAEEANKERSDKAQSIVDFVLPRQNLAGEGTTLQVGEGGTTEIAVEERQGMPTLKGIAKLAQQAQNLKERKRLGSIFANLSPSEANVLKGIYTTPEAKAKEARVKAKGTAQGKEDARQEIKSQFPGRFEKTTEWERQHAAITYGKSVEDLTQEQLNDTREQAPLLEVDMAKSKAQATERARLVTEQSLQKTETIPDNIVNRIYDPKTKAPLPGVFGMSYKEALDKGGVLLTKRQMEFVDSIEELKSSVFTLGQRLNKVLFESAPGAAIGGKLVDIFEPFFEEASLFNDLAGSKVSPFARIVGREMGNLSDGDVGRFRRALPELNDTQRVGRAKLKLMDIALRASENIIFARLQGGEEAMKVITKNREEIRAALDEFESGIEDDKNTTAISSFIEKYGSNTPTLTK